MGLGHLASFSKPCSSCIGIEIGGVVMAATAQLHTWMLHYILSACLRACHAMPLQMVVDYNFVEQTYRECCMIANNTIHNSPIFSTH